MPRRSLGKKRRYISDEQIEDIVSIYTNFVETENCKIVEVDEFIYHEYAVHQPLQRNYRITEERIAGLAEGKFSDTMHNPAKLEELRLITQKTAMPSKIRLLPHWKWPNQFSSRCCRCCERTLLIRPGKLKEFIKHLRVVLGRPARPLGQTDRGSDEADAG